jgi:APA family basic amino acid/polyamine antiporter
LSVEATPVPAAVTRTGADDREFIKGLGLTSSTMLVMGSMIGSGIFLVSAEIAREVDSPALLIGAWVVTAFMTMIAALSYGELAAMMPHAGGQYVYLREALGPLWGFLYGWTLFLVIQTGTIAAVGVAFGRFLGVFFPSISSTHWLIHFVKVPAIHPFHIHSLVLGNMDVGLNTQNLMAVLLVVVLSIINIFGIKTGAIIQDVFTFAKVSALLGLVVFGLIKGRNAAALAANFGANFWHGIHNLHPVQVGVNGPIVLVGTLTILAVAQVGSLFSADAWNNVTFTAGEVKNPKRNLPLSLALGTGVVLALYLGCNFIYLNVLPLDGSPHGGSILAQGIKYASYPDDRVATAALSVMFGSIGAYIMAAAIMVSSFGCNNGLILSGARVYYAMAKDGLFFRSAGKLHPTYKTPAASLMVQMVWICILCVSGSYGQLLDYVVFAVLVFYILTIAGLFVLRYKQPNAERPYKAIGYPVLPAVYIVMAVFIDVVLLLYKPQFTWPGLIIVLLGIPVYYIWRSRRTAAESSAA